VRLEELDLCHCGLEALPEGIGALTTLRLLDLDGNRELTALPAGLGRLPNLVRLGLFGCPGLATLCDLRWREDLLAVLARLAAQSGEPAAGTEAS
jgi:hypothetical protein